MATPPIPVECPSCRLSLRLRREYLGQRVCCRHCGQVFLAVESADAAAGEASPSIVITAVTPTPGDDEARGNGRGAADEKAESGRAVATASGDVPRRGLVEVSTQASEVERLTNVREPHLLSLATLRHAWDAERQGWREQVEAVSRHSERERAALQAMTELLRDELEGSALRLVDRDAQLKSLVALLETSRTTTAAVPPAPAATGGVATEAELASLRAERDGAREKAEALAVSRDAARRSLEEAEARHRAEVSAAADQFEALRGEAERLRDALASVRRPVAADRALVLCRDLARWSEGLPADRPPRPATVVAAVPIGPPPLPPSLDDLETVEGQVEMLRNLLRISADAGKPYHALFDLPRFQLIQAKLKEAGLLADRLVSQFERSRNQKDLLWHLMVAQRNDEINRKKR